jgi:mannitol/fructose-specific phosphotransferase system IIA component (Ntr-type)
VGLLPKEHLYRDLTPVPHAAEILVGPIGGVLLTVAAILAFFSVTNAAILSASRYPLAMSRDHLIPGFFRALSKHKTPKNAIYVTLAMILICIFLLNPTKIAKLASAFQLLLFAMSCLAVIIMRESRIESYDPGYHSPLYPWMHIIGVVAPLFLIWEMGLLPILFTIGLIGLGTLLYFGYARDRVAREGAIYHIFARLGNQRFEGLDRELRGILIEKGVREKDPYDVVIASASLIDIKNKTTFNEIVEKAVAEFSKKFPHKSKVMIDGFMQGTRVGATPVSHGVALPHMRLPDIDHPEMVMVRTKKGVIVEIDEEFIGEEEASVPVHAFFFLISPEENPGQHLRILAQLAGHVDDDKFMRHWLAAQNEQEIKEILLRDDRYLSLILQTNHKTESLIGKAIYDLELPEGSLIVIIHRAGNIVIPRGHTILQEGDRLTIIGYPEGIEKLYQDYGDSPEQQ